MNCEIWSLVMHLTVRFDYHMTKFKDYSCHYHLKLYI